jgi:hypothetical protein
MVSAVIILILICYIILRKPEIIIQDLGREQRLKDSIQLLTKQIDSEKAYTLRSKQIAESLLALPPVITIIYREQKKFTSVATINQLDSIIRANSGLQPRIKRQP